MEIPIFFSATAIHGPHPLVTWNRIVIRIDFPLAQQDVKMNGQPPDLHAEALVAVGGGGRGCLSNPH